MSEPTTMPIDKAVIGRLRRLLFAIRGGHVTTIGDRRAYHPVLDQEFVDEIHEAIKPAWDED